MAQEIKTYHCLCHSLLLTSTLALPTLPRRRRDDAYILPTPRSHTQISSDALAHDSPSDSSESESTTEFKNTAVLSSLSIQPATIVTGEDGVEKRYFVRCKRCALVVGYRLDWGQFGEGRKGRRDDVVYVLPGAMVGTGEMLGGKEGE